MKKNKTPDEFFENENRWKKELSVLREIIGETELKEDFKWNFPVYTLGGKNVLGIGSFKSYFGIWFFQGSFMKDRAGKLINAQEEKTKAMRQWRFNSIDEIDKDLIIEYLNEAIDNQKRGKEIKPDRTKPLEIPEELASKLSENKDLAKAFEAFSLSCRREFAEHIAEAKREDTRQRRLEKILPMIMNKKGLNDKYK